MGYVIKHVYKNIYYKNSINLFGDFVDDLYKKRMEYKKKDNIIMSTICKIVLNSLYGKFAEKPDDKTDIFFMEINKSTKKYKKIEIVENNGITIFMCTKEGKPSAYCFPEISAYITAYARIDLYNLICKYEPFYVDTDSIFTEKEIIISDELGGLKLEHDIKRACYIKPKFYAFENVDGFSKGKCKGIHLKMDYDNLIDIVTKKEITYTKFAKFKESMRIKDETKRRYVNEIISVHKDLNLNDNKRVWLNKEFNFILEESTPIILN